MSFLVSRNCNVKTNKKVKILHPKCYFCMTVLEENDLDETVTHILINSLGKKKLIPFYVLSKTPCIVF